MVQADAREVINADESDERPNVEERGLITWLSSDEDGGPDCGATLGLGDGYVLQIGEISTSLFERFGGDEMGLGNDMGHWIVLFGPTEDKTMLLGRAPEGIDADEALTRLKHLMLSPPGAELNFSNGAESEAVSLNQNLPVKP